MFECIVHVQLFVYIKCVCLSACVYMFCIFFVCIYGVHVCVCVCVNLYVVLCTIGMLVHAFILLFMLIFLVAKY